MEKLYKYSEILEIQTEGDFAVLHNIITKERFKITLKSASIMSYLEGVEDFTYENLQKKFSFFFLIFFSIFFYIFSLL